MENTMNQAKEHIRKNIKWILPQKTGGQTTGILNVQAHLVSEDIDFEVKIAFYRSYIRNQKLALTLFELALDEYFNF